MTLSLPLSLYLLTMIKIVLSSCVLNTLNQPTSNFCEHYAFFAISQAKSYFSSGSYDHFTCFSYDIDKVNVEDLAVCLFKISLFQ